MPSCLCPRRRHAKKNHSLSAAISLSLNRCGKLPCPDWSGRGIFRMYELTLRLAVQTLAAPEPAHSASVAPLHAGAYDAQRVVARVVQAKKSGPLPRAERNGFLDSKTKDIFGLLVKENFETNPKAAPTPNGRRAFSHSGARHRPRRRGRARARHCTITFAQLTVHAVASPVGRVRRTYKAFR